MALLALRFQQPCSVQWIQMGGVSLFYFDISKLVSPPHHILGIVLLSTTLSDQNACLKKGS